MIRLSPNLDINLIIQYLLVFPAELMWVHICWSKLKDVIKMPGWQEAGLFNTVQNHCFPSLPPSHTRCITCLPSQGRLGERHAHHCGSAVAVACSLFRPSVLCQDIQAFFASGRNEGTGNSHCLPTPLSYLAI